MLVVLFATEVTIAHLLVQLHLQLYDLVLQALGHFLDVVNGACLNLEAFEFTLGGLPAHMALQADEAIAHLAVAYTTEPAPHVLLDDDSAGLALLGQESTSAEQAPRVALDGADGVQLVQVDLPLPVPTPAGLDDSRRVCALQPPGVSARGRVGVCSQV